MDDGDSGGAPAAMHRLIAAAGLPAATSVQPLDGDGYGLDNRLTRATLADGRGVLLRQSRLPTAPVQKRIEFLRANGITTPELYACDNEGSSLWEYVPGRTLADAVADGTADDAVWRRTGAALAEVHAVRFPASLNGSIGTDSLTLRPVDPVDELRGRMAAAQRWLEQHQPRTLASIEELTRFVSAHASEVRYERPAVVHGDINLFNIIVNDEAVRLIDWDSPAVKQPLRELSALDEHAYLHNLDGLPPSFFDGYAYPVPRHLLLAYRIVGCVGWLASDDWAEWRSTSELHAATRSRLEHWHQLLLDWCDRIPDLVATLR